MRIDFVWWVCISLEVMLLVRAVRGRLFPTFPLFYCYILLVLIIDLMSGPVYVYYPALYPSFYWATELVLAAVSCGVLLEIYNQSLKTYPGVARFFRVLLLVVFLAVAIRVGMGSWGSLHISFGRTVAELERNLRQLQGILLCCLLGLFVYYKIAIGKNLRGLVFGYTLFIAADLITLTFIAHPATGLSLLMRKIEPILYALALFIWLWALWESRAQAASEAPCGIEKDYEHLSQETRLMLVRARAHLARAVRP